MLKTVEKTHPITVHCKFIRRIRMASCQIRFQYCFKLHFVNKCLTVYKAIHRHKQYEYIKK